MSCLELNCASSGPTALPLPEQCWQSCRYETFLNLFYSRWAALAKTHRWNCSSSYSFGWREAGSAGRALGTVICTLEKQIPLKVALLGHLRVTPTYTSLCSVHLSLLYVLMQASNQSALNSPLKFPKHLCVKCLSKSPSTVVCWCEMSTPSENRRKPCAKVCRDSAAGLCLSSRVGMCWQVSCRKSSQLFVAHITAN